MPDQLHVDLDEHCRSLLSGSAGPAMKLAMDVVLRAAEISRAGRLIDVSFAHIDACFYNGQAHVDFARFMVDNAARLAVPAWTNSGLVSLGAPELRGGPDDSETVAGARELMALYARLGCRTVWTCAPYQLPGGPGFGDHIIGSESNAVTFYNSVVGARTNKYGDFLDVCAALVGRVPDAGLHRSENRRGQLLFTLEKIPEALRAEDLFHHVLGHYVGTRAGALIPVIDGLPGDTSKDQLKALSAAMAASGGVALFHGIGVTPEARDRETACQGRAPDEIIAVSPEALLRARDALNSGGDGPLDMVALGTPHFSFTEFEQLVALLDGRKVADGLVFYVATSRHVRDLAAARGWTDTLEAAGVSLVVDTCTYFSPAVRGCRGRAMTNSAKWAYYAPGMLPVAVVFGSLGECVASAVRGEVVRDDALWRPANWGQVS